METKMTTSIYNKEISCPVCGWRFITKKVKTRRTRLKKVDPDFCPHYEGINPLFYSAYVCPECGYSALEKDFKNITIYGKQAVINNSKRKRVRKEYSGTRDLDAAIEIHKLVLQNYSIMEYPCHVMGKLCLKIAWLYRYSENPKEELYLRHSLKLLNESFLNERLDENPQNETNIIYLLGELNRRLGNYKKSIEWFGIALKSEGMINNRRLERRARDQWSDARESYKEIKKIQGKQIS